MCGQEKCVCTQQFSFDRIIAPFYYLEPVRGSIHRFKFRNSGGYAKAFAGYICESLEGSHCAENADMITFVPLLKRDQKRRGYNQAQLIAKELSRLLDLPVKPLIRKVRRTEKQHDLSAEQRKQNLAGAFEAEPCEDVRGKTIILCDDVVTTGSTLDETAKTLKSAGAKAVICCVVASSYCTNGDFMAK